MLRSYHVEGAWKSAEAVRKNETKFSVLLINPLSLLLGLASVQLMMATAHIIVFLFLVKKGFIDNSQLPNGTAQYFSNTSTTIYAAQFFFFISNVRIFVVSMTN